MSFAVLFTALVHGLEALSENVVLVVALTQVLLGNAELLLELGGLRGHRAQVMLGFDFSIVVESLPDQIESFRISRLIGDNLVQLLRQIDLVLVGIELLALLRSRLLLSHRLGLRLSLGGDRAVRQLWGLLTRILVDRSLH